jgi:hypothetical protein
MDSCVRIEIYVFEKFKIFSKKPPFPSAEETE